MEKIYFYSTKGDYGFMSNFSRHPIVIDGKQYHHSEGYFQSQKFPGTRFESEIAKEKNPMEAAKMGRDHSKPLRKDWESVKYQIMKQAVLAKFSQHEGLKKKLLETGDAELVEHTEKDNVWADGGDGSGQNLLGKILMEVRKELNNEKNT